LLKNTPALHQKSQRLITTSNNRSWFKHSPNKQQTMPISTKQTQIEIEKNRALIFGWMGKSGDKQMIASTQINFQKSRIIITSNWVM